MKYLRYVLVFVVLTAVFSQKSAFAGTSISATYNPLTMNYDVTLMWNASAGATGYKIYYGNASRTYNQPINVGNRTRHTLMGVESGRRYFFTATAYNQLGESAYGVEISIPVCDCNRNGSIDLIDIDILADRILDNSEKIIYDINLDGVLNVRDVTALVDIYLDDLTRNKTPSSGYMPCP